MASQADYSASANALVPDLHDLIAHGIPGTGFSGVPLMFQGLVPAALIPAMAGRLAKIAIDAVDKHRAEMAPHPGMAPPTPVLLQKG